MENKAEYNLVMDAVKLLARSVGFDFPPAAVETAALAHQLDQSKELLARLEHLAGLLASELSAHAKDCGEATKQLYRLYDLRTEVNAFLAGGEINVVTRVLDADDTLAAWRSLAIRIEEANSEAGILVERCENNPDNRPELYAEAILAQTLLERAAQVANANVQDLEEQQEPVPVPPSARVLANK